MVSTVHATGSNDGASVLREVEGALSDHLGAIMAASIMRWLVREMKTDPSRTPGEDLEALRRTLSRSLYVDATVADQVVSEVAALKQAARGDRAATPGVRMTIGAERDVADARMRLRDLARVIGFHEMEAVKVATVASELSRNIFQYARLGTLEGKRIDAPRAGIELVAKDTGPGIDALEAVLAGTYRSRTGLGLGLTGSRRLMDTFEIASRRGVGTTITARKYLGGRRH